MCGGVLRRSEANLTFHWDPVLGRFEVLKVKCGAWERIIVCETSLDARLFAGVVCEDCFFTLVC